MNSGLPSPAAQVVRSARPISRFRAVRRSKRPRASTGHPPRCRSRGYGIGLPTAVRSAISKRVSSCAKRGPRSPVSSRARALGDLSRTARSSAISFPSTGLADQWVSASTGRPALMERKCKAHRQELLAAHFLRAANDNGVLRSLAPPHQHPLAQECRSTRALAEPLGSYRTLALRAAGGLFLCTSAPSTLGSARLGDVRCALSRPSQPLSPLRQRLHSHRAAPAARLGKRTSRFLETNPGHRPLQSLLLPERPRRLAHSRKKEGVARTLSAFGTVGLPACGAKATPRSRVTALPRIAPAARENGGVRTDSCTSIGVDQENPGQ